MVRKKYTEEHIIAVLKEAEAGAKLPDLCRKYGMSDATYYNWKAKYSGMTASDLKRLSPGRRKPPAQTAGCRASPG